jgi:pyrroloquinoline quinone biosynthesis protein B
VSPRTQSSVAVSRTGSSWTLLNASPDLRQQIAATPELWPQIGGAMRTSPIAAVVLTNADVDHVAGLLSMREGLGFSIYASSNVHDALAANAIFDVLDQQHVTRLRLPLDHPQPLADGLVVEAFAVPGKVALYLENGAADFGTRVGDTIGLKIFDPQTDAEFFYIPGCAAVDDALAVRLRGAPLVLFDGTLYTDNEMIALGLSSKTGRRMGHISMAGPEGSMAAFATLNVRRRVYVHMNNSNPALREGSPERAEVERAGWEIAWDGMEIRL